MGSTGSAVSWLLPNTLLGLHLQLGQGVEKGAVSLYCLGWLWSSWAVNTLGPSGVQRPPAWGPTRPFPPGAVRSPAVRPLRQGSGQMSQARVDFLGAGHVGDPPILAPAGILALHSEAGCPLLPQSVLPSLLLQWHKGGSARPLRKEVPSWGIRGLLPLLMGT